MIELILEASLIGGLLIAGYLLNHTRLNIFTLVAILACLPACRALVNLIMLLPHHSMDEATELEISGVTEYLTMLYDLVITSERKAMPVDAIAISGKTICGYARNKKVDTNYCARHIKSILAQNKIEKVTVKIKDYGCLSNQQIEELNSGARISVDDKKENPLDFALWKKTEVGIKWDSPFGSGRPGWHTECVVMNHKLFVSFIPLIDAFPYLSIKSLFQAKQSAKWKSYIIT